MVKQNVRIVVVSARVLKDQTEKYIVQIVTTKNGVNIRGSKLQYITMIRVAKFVKIQMTKAQAINKHLPYKTEIIVTNFQYDNLCFS